MHVIMLKTEKKRSSLFLRLANLRVPNVESPPKLFTGYTNAKNKRPRGIGADKK